MTLDHVSVLETNRATDQKTLAEVEFSTRTLDDWFNRYLDDEPLTFYEQAEQVPLLQRSLGVLATAVDPSSSTTGQFAVLVDTFHQIIRQVPAVPSASIEVALVSLRGHKRSQAELLSRDLGPTSAEIWLAEQVNEDDVLAGWISQIRQANEYHPPDSSERLKAEIEDIEASMSRKVNHRDWSQMIVGSYGHDSQIV